LVSIKNNLVVLLVCLGTTFMVDAASFRVETTKKLVDLSEYFEIKYIIEGANASNLNPGDLSPFTIKSGPNENRKVTYINGKVNQSLTYSYYVQAKQEGTYKIAGASVFINKKKYRAKEVSITVNKAKATAKADSIANKSQGKFEDFVYIDIELDKDTVYKGEQVIARYNLYTLYQISNFNITKNPSLPGFWLRNLNDRSYPQTQKIINGSRYRVVELKRVALFPQKSGNLSLDEIEIEGYVKVKKSRQRSNDPFEQLFDNPFFGGGRYTSELRKIKSSQKELIVKELPTPIPDGFTGGVGSFTASAIMQNRKAKTDETITLNFTINGTGNIKLLEGPELVLPDGLEAYDSKVTENIYTNSGVVRGSKKFEYPIIPRQPGKYKIEPLTWYYFDVEKESYQQYRLGPYSLQIDPGDDYADNQSTFDEGAYQLKPIKTDNLKIDNAKRTILITKPILVAFAGLPIFLLPFIGFLNRRKLQNRPSESELQYSQAQKVAIGRLSEAKNLMSKNEDKPFYDEVIRAVWDYLKNKFGIANAEMDKAIIQKTLTENDINENTTKGLTDVISLCEIALFAPSAAGSNQQNVYDKAVQHISEIESQLS